MKKPWIIVEEKGNKFEIFARDYLRAHLIFQEVDMWFNHPEMYTKEDFDFIVNRRGFNNKEIETLKRLCIFIRLKPIWA